MDSKFRIDDVADGTTRLLIAQGELDASDVAQIRDGVEHALAVGAQHVVLDLCGSTRIESAVIAAVLDANARTRRFGARLSVVVAPDSRVQSLFEMSRLDHVVRVVATRQEALDSP
jgi:anti-anti-sigma factor